uniref:Sulfatase N-terminal domain-containing protein n=1 Tax=Strongyloides stercoralis TaxID=6248 RepID=A0AAF5DPA4_STRER
MIRKFVIDSDNDSFNYRISYKNFYKEKIINDKILTIGDCFLSKDVLFSDNYLKYVDDFNVSKINEINNNYCIYKYRNDFYHLQDGLLFVKSKNIKCKYRCKIPDGDKNITNTYFIDIIDIALLPCDIFEIICNDTINNKTLYDYNFHIRRVVTKNMYLSNILKNKYKPHELSKQYDVILYIVNFLSNYHAHRALNKTRKYLLNNFNGFEMNYLNVQGNDSRSNIYGLLLNKQNNNVTDQFENKKIKINDWFTKSACNEYLEVNTYLPYLYKSMGYVTLLADDSENGGIFNFPNCQGFKKNVVHHYFRPFQNFFHDKNIKKFLLKKFEKQCQSHGFHIMEYFEKFLIRYKYNVKMAVLWQTTPMKNNMKDIFYYDHLFEEFFDNQSEYINNSFLFFLGDYGYGNSNYSKTFKNSFEYKNPYFFISVPYDLRQNKELIKNLKDNSNKHISFMDIYATLLDILTEGRRDKYQNFGYYNLSNTVNFNIKGSSLFRPIFSNNNRSCYDMYIPKHNCFCKILYEKLPKSFVNEYYKLKQAFITVLNKKIKNINVNKNIKKILINEKFFEAKIAMSPNEDILYQVDSVTIPGNKKFRAFFNKEFELVNNEIIKLD